MKIENKSLMKKIDFLGKDLDQVARLYEIQESHQKLQLEYDEGKQQRMNLEKWNQEVGFGFILGFESD